VPEAGHDIDVAAYLMEHRGLERLLHGPAIVLPARRVLGV